MPEVSVVLPVYRNAECLEELYTRLAKVLSACAPSYELIFVNDGCPDGSGRVLDALSAADVRVRVISLASNAGQNGAVLAGLAQAHGSRLVIMDADLQDRPEDIPALLEQLDTGHYGAVFAGRKGAYESGARLATSRAFKKLMHWMCGVPADAGSFVALKREVAVKILSFQVGDPYILAMIGCTGARLASVPLRRDARPRGESAYSAWMRARIGFAGLWTVLRIKWRAATFRRTTA